MDDETDRPQAIVDKLEDLPILHKLQRGTFPSSTSAMERHKIRHKIIRFCWDNDLLVRFWLDETRCIVSRPKQRASLVRQMHEELSHFGIGMTHSMLRGQYWWTGMYWQVVFMSRDVKFVTRSGLASRPCHLNSNHFLLWDWANAVH